MAAEDAAFFSAALALLDDPPRLPPDASEQKLEQLLNDSVASPAAFPIAQAQGEAASATAGVASACVASVQRRFDHPRLVRLLPKPAATTQCGVQAPGMVDVKRRPRPRNYNPNKARDERKREVDQLRLEAAALQRQLRVLRDRRSGLQAAAGVSSSSQDAASKLPRVWEELCRRQLHSRMAKEEENVRLRQALAAQLQVSRHMQRLLHRSTMVDAPSLEELRGSSGMERAVTTTPSSADDEMIFGMLLAAADHAFRQVDALFREIGLFDCEVERRDARVLHRDEGVCLDVFGNKVLPFDVRSTGAAVWNHYRGAEKHQGQLYSKVAQPADNTVKEQFSLELFANNTWADFQVWQVVRKFVDSADRVVVVWVSHVKPVEVSHKVLAGVGFQETGFAVCKRSHATAASSSHPDARSLLQICYRMAPYTTEALATGGELDNSSVRALTAFAISLASSNVIAHQQMIEDVLIDLAVQAHHQRDTRV